MKNKIFWLTFLLFLGYLSSVAQNNLPKWNGYIQSRYANDFDEISEFSIRRAKLWIYGDVPKLDFLSYKVQMVYRSFKDQSLLLQDALVDIKLNPSGKIRVGRFVPNFMLQRMQPDYKIPVLERAFVVDGFTHNEKQIAREMGMSYIYGNDTLPLHFSIGLFNANLDKPAHTTNMNLLYTTRVFYHFFRQRDFQLNFGASFSYRKINDLTLTKIYQPDSLISGDDYRYGTELKMHYKKWALQTEYLEAQINKDKAYGWYVVTDYSLNKHYQIIVLTEKYKDLNPATNDSQWFGTGLNYYFTKNTKFMTDFKAQKSGISYNYLGEVQLQIFFN